MDNWAVFEVQLANGVQFSGEIIVADIEDEGLFGHDLLKQGQSEILYEKDAKLPSRPCSNAWVTHPATNRALRCLTWQLWPDTLRVAVKASSYSEAVCVSYIPVVPITTTPLPPFFFRSQSCPCMSSSNTSDTIVVAMVPSMSATKNYVTTERSRVLFQLSG